MFKDKETVKEIKEKLGIDLSSKIVMYMPTFRDKNKELKFLLEENEIIKSLEIKFGGEWTFIYRTHPVMNGTYATRNGVLNLSSHPDPQELLVITDCLITDYSSSAFDFILTKKPVFLYVPDKNEYEHRRGLYYPIEETPFLIARDQSVLKREIELFNENEYQKNVESFLLCKGVVDDGQASKKIVEIIENNICKVK